MAEPINLNKARKAKAKSADRAQAAANRAAYGRTKSEKEAAKFDAKKAQGKLDAARRDPPER